MTRTLGGAIKQIEHFAAMPTDKLLSMLEPGFMPSPDPDQSWTDRCENIPAIALVLTYRGVETPVVVDRSVRPRIHPDCTNKHLAGLPVIECLDSRVRLLPVNATPIQRCDICYSLGTAYPTDEATATALAARTGRVLRALVTTGTHGDYEQYFITPKLEGEDY